MEVGGRAARGMCGRDITALRHRVDVSRTDSINIDALLVTGVAVICIPVQPGLSLTRLFADHVILQTFVLFSLNAQYWWEKFKKKRIF